MFHAPTLLESIRTPQGREKAHPALYFSILAVSAADWGKTRAEPWTGSLENDTDFGSTLGTNLRDTAFSYLEAGLVSGVTPTLSLLQSASALCILEPAKSARRDMLLHLVESSIDSFKLGELVKDPPNLKQTYYSLPPQRESAETEIGLESLTRACWAPSSHRLRVLIVEPDADVLAGGPSYLSDLRPIRYWVPSELPPIKDLPGE